MPHDRPDGYEQPEHLGEITREYLRQRLDLLPPDHPSSPRYDSPQAPVQAEDQERRAARDVIRNIDRAEMDHRKLSEYAMNADHLQNNGKARAWAALGYDVTSPDQRLKTAQELRERICRHLLPEGRVAATKETADGADYRVVNDFIGPNGRHATLVTCWRVPPGEDAGPRLVTTWLALHRDDRR